jgi:hypothetical protein
MAVIMLPVPSKTEGELANLLIPCLFASGFASGVDCNEENELDPSLIPSESRLDRAKDGRRNSTDRLGCTMT